MTIEDLLRRDREQQIGRAHRDRMLRECTKPHIKRFSGKWVCIGRGVKAVGFSPQSAYSAWLMQHDTQIRYATQAQSQPARQLFEGWWPCCK